MTKNIDYEARIKAIKSAAEEMKKVTSPEQKADAYKAVICRAMHREDRGLDF